MPATLQEIYDFETALETAFRSCLESDEGLRPLITRSQGLKPKKSLMIGVKSLGATGSHHYYAPDGLEIEDQYRASLEIGIQTLRQSGELIKAEEAEHTGLKAIMRAWMIRSWLKVNDAMTWHEIDRKPIPGATELDFEEEEYDISILNYELIFSIRPDAWPETV